MASRKFKNGVTDGNITKSELSSFDLSSVKHMINAAEPVDQVAIINFYETFRPFGLSSGVVVPTYGLAEHTVFVCSGGSNILKLNKKDFDNEIINIIEITVLGDSGSQIKNNIKNEITKENINNEITKENINNVSENKEQYIVGCGYPSRGEGVNLLIVEPETHVDLGENKVINLNYQ